MELILMVAGGVVVGVVLTLIVLGKVFANCFWGW